MSQDLVTIRKYNFNGVIVHIKIDRANNRVTIVQPVTNKEFTTKQYIFANRGVEYMNGWINILGALQEAIRDARDDILAYQKKEAKAKEEVIINTLIGLQDLKDKEKKK